MGELDDLVVVDFPLRGEWAAATTPAHRIPSHGTDMLGQRFAFDFVRIDERKGFHLHPAGTLRSYVIGGRTRDCYGGGSPSTRRSTARSSRPSTACRSERGSTSFASSRSS